MKKVALITGASSGIGKETATLLLKNGFTVYAAARRLEIMDDIKKLGAQTIRMDVSDDASMVQGVEKIIAAEGRIDVLVNNAGYGSYGSLEDTPMTEAKYQFEVNVFGLARLSQLVIPYMRKQRSGKIINVTSIAGKIAEPHGSWYHSSKFAVEGLSDCMRMELKQFGIDVVLIEPGGIKTEWNNIARDNLVKVSGQTVYKDLANKQVRMLKFFDAIGSKPIVIAKTIHRAINARWPKARYVAGRGSTTMLTLKKILPDKMFDRMILIQLKFW
jgi:NAD(P)-dependent dehydrogenase (short-subunit alcohol dehydrogenase family)